MASQPSSSVYNAVEPTAKQLNIPDSIWETVAYIESGFNPGATHLESTGYNSIGLFQLEQVVGQGGGYSATYLANPANNAKIGLPAIGKAWSSLSGSFDPNSLNWWEQFAAQSGHPGGSPGNSVTDAEATKLMAAYKNFIATGTPPALSNKQSSTSGDCCNGDLGCQVCVNVVTSVGGSPEVCCSAAPSVAAGVQNSLTPDFSGLTSWMQNAGIVLVGVVIIVVAIILFFKPGQSQ